MKKILVALLLVSTLFATLLVPAHATEPKLEAVFAEGAVDVDFDSAADVNAVYTGTDATMTVVDGVLKLATNKASTNFTEYRYDFVFEKASIDLTKSFGYSLRFRASDAKGTFVQLWSNMQTGDQFGQLNDKGRFGITACASGPSINKAGDQGDNNDSPANQAAIDTGVTNLKDNEWHTVDVIFAPKAEGATTRDFVAVIDGVVVYDSKTGEDATLEGKVNAANFREEISTFFVKFYTQTYDGSKDWTFEVDYFRAGNAELQEVALEEDNGDTSDMTASVVVAAVALVATTTVVLRKKSR